MDVKSSPVYFYVQRTSEWFTPNAPISFDRELLNIGNAMNLATGVFTAPKGGTYHFDFSYVKTSSESDGYGAVRLDLNGNQVASSFDRLIGLSAQSLHSTLSLKAGDRVSLSIYAGSLYDDSTPSTDFTGWLVEEELVI